jgi:hypothetical protein
MKKFIALITFLLIVTVVQMGNAQTVYVNSTTGNDATGNGTSGSPYKTFYKGYTMASTGNTINLTGTFTWTDAGETGDAATTGYTISKNLTINGQGSGVTIIQAATTENNADRRVFTIGSGYSVTIQNLTIRYGYLTNGNGAAAIYMGGTTSLSLLNCIIERNNLYYNCTDGRYEGGAIQIYYLSSGSVNIDKCQFQYNTNTGGSSNSGGAIHWMDWSTNTGLITITNSTFNNNIAVSGSAIFARSSRSTISNSTFSNNTGGTTLYYSCGSSSTNLVYGYLTNVTVAYNTLGTYGYGVYESSMGNGSTGTLGLTKGLMLKNCIIAQNKTTGNTQQDYNGGNSSHTVNNGYNLVEAKTGSENFTNGVNGCIVGVQANLRLSNTLGYNNTSNGTQTLALYGGSVAVNAGNSSANGNISIPATDQRGKARSGNYDMGAFEYNACIWKGTTSTDFGTASNWNESAVPEDGSDIAIDPAATNNCVLGDDKTIGSFYNANSTYKMVLNGKALTVRGDISLSGSAQFDASSGDLIFYGGTYSSTITPSSSTLSIINLNINNSYGIALGGNLTVSNTLTLTNGLLTLGAYNLTLGSSASISGTPSASKMIVATSTGELRKTFTGIGSFTFPVGDNTGTAEYSPITLNFTSGTFSSAYAGVTLGNSKYSNNTSSTDYLNRYWTVNQSGISSFSCNVTAQYLPADVIGTEGNIYAGKYSSGWTLLNQTDAVNHRITGTVTGFSTFTGGQQSVMPVELSSFGSIVNGRDAKLQWITSSEKNNAGFEIQKSIVGNQNSEWNKIGYIQGNGTKNTPTNYSFTDAKLNTGKYNYRLKQIDNNGNFAYHNLNNTVEIGAPVKFNLSQNYPNPFNPKTKIDFQIPLDAKVTMKIYDITGREMITLLNNEYKKADYYTVDFNASNLASGTYFYRITADKFISTKKMLLIK